MRLQPGQTAPDFSVSDINGREIRLADYADKKLILAFLRYAGCPFCNFILKNIIHQLDLIQDESINILVFFQSPADSIRDYPAQQKPSFPLIADPDRKIYDLYGVETSPVKTLTGMMDLPLYYDVLVRNGFKQGKIDGNLFLMPAYFLIGPPNTTIRKTHYAVNFADQGPLLDMKQFALFNEGL